MTVISNQRRLLQTSHLKSPKGLSPPSMLGTDSVHNYEVPSMCPAPSKKQIEKEMLQGLITQSLVEIHVCRTSRSTI